MAEPTVYFNPSCSKCRTAAGILADKGVEATFVRYLDTPPTIAELRVLMTRLGIEEPRAMMRTGEPIYEQLGLRKASPDELLAAVVAHPILLERPIVVVGERAVIARPAERLLEILSNVTVASATSDIHHCP
jgi:arsenate reductase